MNEQKEEKKQKTVRNEEKEEWKEEWKENRTHLSEFEVSFKRDVSEFKRVLSELKFHELNSRKNKIKS